MTRVLTTAFFGLIIGLAGSLLYVWVIAPARPDITPASLRADHQIAYIELVAQTYVADKDIDHARLRLASLGSVGSVEGLTALTQRTAASGGDPATVRSLASLAAALGANPSPPTPNIQPSPANTPLPGVTLEPTATQSPTALPSPTLAPSATPILETGFQLIDKVLVCDSQIGQPLIQVVTLNRDGEQLPGLEIVVEWDGGFDHFFTGLKPELGDGYGDFTMTPGIVYNLHLVADPSATAPGLAIPDCPDSSGNYAGSWQLVFRQP